MFNKTEEYFVMISQKGGEYGPFRNRCISVYSLPSFDLVRKITIRGPQLRAPPVWLGAYTLLMVQSSVHVCSIDTSKKVTLGKRMEECLYDSYAVAEDKELGRKLLIGYHDFQDNALTGQVIKAKHGDFDTKEIEKTFEFEGKPNKVHLDGKVYRHCIKMFTHIKNRVYVCPCITSILEFDLSLVKLREIRVCDLVPHTGKYGGARFEAAGNDGLILIKNERAATAHVWDPISGLLLKTKTIGDEEDPWTAAWKIGSKPVIVLNGDESNPRIKKF
eukprot:sb/3468061/